MEFFRADRAWAIQNWGSHVTKLNVSPLRSALYWWTAFIPRHPLQALGVTLELGGWDLLLPEFLPIATFGDIGSTSANARVGQLALRFSFYSSRFNALKRRVSAHYFFTSGGYFFRSFSTALLMFFCFFSGFALGSRVFEAVPLQTNCFAAGSYMLMSNCPT